MSRYEVTRIDNLLARLNSIHRISGFWQDYILARSYFQNYYSHIFSVHTFTHSTHAQYADTHVDKRTRRYTYVDSHTQTYCLRFVVYTSKGTQEQAQRNNINKYFKTFLIVEQTLKEMIRTNQKFYFSQNPNPYLKSIKFTLHLNLHQITTSDQILNFLQPSRTPTFSMWLIL